MKLDLIPTFSVKGYSQLYGIHHSEIKAVSKKTNLNTLSKEVEAIKADFGQHTKEYRLVKEKKGYIFRCTITDTGMNGHFTSKKEAIASALKWTIIHIDEPFSYSNYEGFKIIEKQHALREKGNCKHPKTEDYHCCDCGICLRQPETSNQ